MRREVVVAFDGSPHSRAAVEQAARETRVRGAELTVCHVWDGPHAEREAAITDQERRLAGRTLMDGVQLAERLLPGRPVRSILARGSPGPELVLFSRTAEMLVVGSRGLGRVAGLLLGSVSAHAVVHAFCPVLAVPERVDPRSRAWPADVVVGVDGSSCSLAALTFALGYARNHRLPVHVIHAKADAFLRQRAEAERWVAEAMTRLSPNHRDVVVTISTPDGSPYPPCCPAVSGPGCWSWDPEDWAASGEECSVR